MDKAIIDTCFFEQFNKGIRFSEDDFCTLMYAMQMEILIHPYVYDKELSMHAYIDTLINKGLCRVVDYEEFLTTEYFKEMYRGLFVEIYNEFYNRKLVSNSRKAEKMHQLGQDTDIFEVRFSGASIGDVHIIMMAFFMNIPIILSEDNVDMMELYEIAKNKMNSDQYQLVLYKIKDVIEIVKDKKILSGKEIKRFRRAYTK